MTWNIQRKCKNVCTICKQKRIRSNLCCRRLASGQVVKIPQQLNNCVEAEHCLILSESHTVHLNTQILEIALRVFSVRAAQTATAKMPEKRTNREECSNRTKMITRNCTNLHNYLGFALKYFIHFGPDIRTKANPARFFRHSLYLLSFLQLNFSLMIKDDDCINIHNFIWALFKTRNERERLDGRFCFHIYTFFSSSSLLAGDIIGWEFVFLHKFLCEIHNRNRAPKRRRDWMFYLYALVSHLIYTVNTVSKTLVKLGMMKLHGFVLIGFAQYFHELNASSNIYMER